MIYQFEINCPFVVVKKSWSLFPWREKSRYLSFFTVGKKKNIFMNLFVYQKLQQ